MRKLIRVSLIAIALATVMSYSTAQGYFTQFLQKGSSGVEVKQLQSALKTNSSLYPEGGVTGYFGVHTEQAVQRFQAKYGIVNYGTPYTTGYGLVGKRTRAKLNEVFSSFFQNVPPPVSFIQPPTPTQQPTTSCTQDIWNCGDWSACSINGSQYRTCQLTYDCPIISTPQPTSTQSCTPLQLSPVAPGTRKSSMGHSITTDIVVDTDSSSPSDDELSEFFRIANNILVNKADTELRLGKIRKISYNAIQSSSCVGCLSSGTNTGVFYEIYKNEPEPEFIIFLHADDTSSLYGAYSTALESRNGGFCNRFKSARGYTNRIYIDVQDWNHSEFATCGYDYSDPKNPKHVSNVSTRGECRNTPGIACILKGTYYQCGDATTQNSFDAKNPNVPAASAAVHELMHQFGVNGDLDHYGATKCPMPITNFDKFLNDAQEYAGICPSLFDVFKNNYQSC